MNRFFKSLIFLNLILLGSNALSQTRFGFERGTLYHKFTEAVAFRLNYYALLTDLRAKTENFLIDLDLKIRNHIVDLRFNDLDLIASSQKYELNNAFESISTMIDEIFDQEDRVFLYTAEKLDLKDATIEEKTDFVNNEKKKITEQINNAIKYGEAKYLAITNIPKERPTYSCYHQMSSRNLSNYNNFDRSHYTGFRRTY